MFYPSSKKEWFALAFLLYSNFLFWMGCGYVGDPLPPLIQIPKPITDLAAVQLGRYIKLSWTLPKLNTDGSTVTTLSRLEIYRLRYKPASAEILDQKTFSQTAMKWMVLDKVNFDAYKEGEKLVLTDRLERLDNQEVFQSSFHYAIKGVNKKKQDAGFSNLASLRVFRVPNPPEGIRFSFGEQFVGLSWKSPSLNIDGSPFEGEVKFNVYRSVIPEARVRELLTKIPLEETSFKDVSMVLGQTYYYTVRSIIDTPTGLVESFDSQEQEAKNVDAYPPRVPAEVSAISNGETISLVWLPNTETDLAGYHVYRREENQDYHRLTEQLISTASYLDKSVERGKTYTYRIKAVDKSGNESNFSEEVSDRVE